MSGEPCATCGHPYVDHTSAYFTGGCRYGACTCPKYVEPRLTPKCANCGHHGSHHDASGGCVVMHGTPLGRCSCMSFEFPETRKPPAKIIDPKCLNCGHLWSAHFVNDPDPRCSLRTEAGKELWCGCAAFRGGCAKCNHSMDEHGSFGLGMCQHKDWSAVAQPNVGANRCTCDGYEPMRRELPAPISKGAQ